MCPRVQREEKVKRGKKKVSRKCDELCLYSVHARRREFARTLAPESPSASKRKTVTAACPATLQSHDSLTARERACIYNRQRPRRVKPALAAQDGIERLDLAGGPEQDRLFRVRIKDRQGEGGGILNRRARGGCRPSAPTR